MQAFPNFRKAWADTQVADHLHSRKIHLLQMEEGLEEEGLPFAPLEETLSTVDGAKQKRRIRIQDMVRHPMVLYGEEAPPVRAPRVNHARELSQGIDAKKKARKGAERERSNCRSCTNRPNG